jgi:hypothetical protein
MKLPPGWELPEQIKFRLGENPGKQRSMVADGHLLMILHKVPKPSIREREGIFFWRSPEGEWKYSGGQGGVSMLKTHLDEYNLALESLEKVYDNARCAEDFFKVLESVAPLHRAAKNQYQVLQESREAFPDAREIIGLRDISSDIDRSSELLQLDAKYALDFHIAKQAEEQAKISNELAQASHKLNMLAAFFLPLMAVTGIFGMEMSNGFTKESPLFFWTIVTFGISLGFGVVLLMNLKSTEKQKRKKILG